MNQHSTDTFDVLSAVITTGRNCVTDNENIPVSVSSDAIKEFGDVNERDNETSFNRARRFSSTGTLAEYFY